MSIRFSSMALILKGYFPLGHENYIKQWTESYNMSCHYCYNIIIIP